MEAYQLRMALGYFGFIFIEASFQLNPRFCNAARVMGRRSAAKVEVRR